MKKAHGLRRYFYEYLFAESIDQARSQTGLVIPVSQAKSLRRELDARLGGDGLADPALPLSTCLSAVNAVITDRIPGAQPIFASTDTADASYQRFQAGFSGLTGVGTEQEPAESYLPISPYDPRWSTRSTVKQAGTAYCYIPDLTIARATQGEVEHISAPQHGAISLYAVSPRDGKLHEAGRAQTLDDSAGLTELMDAMSEREYQAVRGWVLEGGRDPKTGRLDSNRFMSEQAIARSAAVLADLRAQGVSYEVLRDREPGQIKARIAGSGLEIRLTDTVQEAYAGARVYDNGTVVRYSTNYRITGGMATYSPTPEEAVELVRFARGQALERHDAPGQIVGEATGTHAEKARGQAIVEIPDSYHVERESMFVVKDYDVPGGNTDERLQPKVMLRRDTKSRSMPMFFLDPESAEHFIGEAVSTARENFEDALQVEALITHVNEQWAATGGDRDSMDPPEYSSDTEIASIQRAYWDVLTGARRDLLRPGATEEMYNERVESIGEADLDTHLGNLVYTGRAADKVREHAHDVAFELIGTAQPETHLIDGEYVEQRFDAGRVARYMTSSTGQWSNLENLASALRCVGAQPEQMMGTGFQSTRFKDRLARFDEAIAQPITEHESPFLRRMGQVVEDSIRRNAVTPTSVQIDEQGVVHWEGQKLRRDGSTTPLSGEIGQIFDVGEYGEIVTQFASGENALVVPGFEARIAAQDPARGLQSVEERTLLRGYEQLMAERISYQISNDCVTGRSVTGEPSSLNGVYSQLYGTKHPVTFIEQNLVRDGNGEPVLNSWTRSILETEAKRVRYSNDIKAGSTIFAEYQAQKQELDPANDNTFDAWRLTGGRNMTVLTGTDAQGVEAPGGYFDPVMTGGATNQGIVRYLTQDASVDAEGHIVPGDADSLTGSRAPLMARPELESLRFDPFDRQQMTASTIMQSSEVTQPTGTALMTFGGWGADDGIVVSTDFAREHQIRGVGGQMRDLVVGDKLSDLHGNKGVISLIVDRSMDFDTAEREGIGTEVAWFKSNPSMDVVMSPFSLISRRNAGSARELMQDAVSARQDYEAAMERFAETREADNDAARDAAADVPLDRLQERINEGGYLYEPGGQNMEGTQHGIGQMRFVVTHMAVDEKTKIYDEEQLRAGRGRKASAQLAWALQSQDCPAIMGEFYGHNSGAEATAREFMRVTGVTMDADGTLGLLGADGVPGALTDEQQCLRIPMPELQYTRGRLGASPKLNTVAMRKSFGALIGDRGGDMEIPFPLRFPTKQETPEVDAGVWTVPVLSSYLRSGQEFDDGSSVTHDYTHSYQDIFVEACRYRHQAAQLEDEALSPEDRRAIKESMSSSAIRAQRAFDSITQDVQARVLSGKHNVFKQGLMSSRLPDSATMVWSADPRLDVQQIALHPAKAEHLGLSEGDHALVWRDPVLRDSGVRYMEVVFNERLTGAAINPVMDKCFDGDFDGDSVAIVRLHTEAAKREALDKLSVPANLLDTGVTREDGTHPLAMHVALDTQVALSKNPELAEEFASAEKEANQIEQDARAGDSPAEIRDRRASLTSELSDLYRQAQSAEVGSALSFGTVDKHLASVREVCVETGAKGNEKKLADYARNLGDDAGVSGITQEDQEASMFATAIKAHGTGLGGSFSQRAVRALRGENLKAVLEVTYPVTQSILQAKHDAAEARHKYDMLQGTGRELWRGHIMTMNPKTSQVDYARDAHGEKVQATTADWEKAFVDFYTSPQGFNVDVNPDYVRDVAQALTDPQTGCIRNLEEDPTLQGSVLDRLAYGGDFSTLIDAAHARESIYDGETSLQFAPRAAKQSYRETQRALAAMDAAAMQKTVQEQTREVPAAVAEYEPTVPAMKSDVRAPQSGTSVRNRGGQRRSRLATSIGAAWDGSQFTSDTAVSTLENPQNDAEREF